MTLNITALPTLGVTESGGEIKLRRPLKERVGLVPAEIVLCHLPHNRVTPYATWQRNTDKYEGTYWGHYFRDEDVAEAIDDFMKRGI